MSSTSNASNTHHAPTLRRISGNVRRLSSTERSLLTVRRRRLSSIVEANEPRAESDRIDSMGLDEDFEICTATSVRQYQLRLPRLVTQLNLFEDVQNELSRQSSSSFGTVIATVRSNDDSSQANNIMTLLNSVEQGSAATSKGKGHAVPSLDPSTFRPRSSSLTQRQAALPSLPASRSIHWTPDAELRTIIQDTLRAQIMLNKDKIIASNAPPTEDHAKASKIFENTSTQSSSLADALANALALGHLHQQIRPMEITSEVVQSIIDLLRFPPSRERDAGIRAVLDTIPRCLGVRDNPPPGSQDARLLSALHNLENQLEIASD